MKGQVEFDLGSGLKLTPWAQDQFDLRVNPNMSTDQNKGVLLRNRFFTGLNTTLALDKAFNLGLNLEYRVETGLKGDETLAINALPQQRLTPYLNINGKYDVLYYNLTTDLPMYLDKTVGSQADHIKNFYYELEGTYQAGAAFALDATTTLKTELNYYLDIPNLANYPAVTAGNKNPGLRVFKNELIPKVILVAGDISPYAGFVWDNVSYDSSNRNYVSGTDNLKNSNVLGGLVGSDIKVGNLTFNVQYLFGWDSKNPSKNTSSSNATNQDSKFYSQTSVSVVIKG